MVIMVIGLDYEPLEGRLAAEFEIIMRKSYNYSTYSRRSL